MGCYRDDLEAAQLRISQLEDELKEREASLEQLRSQAASSAQGPRLYMLGHEAGGMGWSAFALTMLIVSAACVSLWHAKRHAEEQSATLRQQLERTRGDAMEAKAEARTALDMILRRVQSVPRELVDEHESGPLGALPDWPGLRDPFVPGGEPFASGDPFALRDQVLSTIEVGSGSAVIWAQSRPDAELWVDGERCGMTPLMLRVDPGAHSLIFVHPERGVQTRSVIARDSEPLRTEVLF